MRSILALGLALLATAALGCGDDDGVATDSGVGTDAGGVMTDGGGVMTDAGSRDSGGGTMADAGGSTADAGPIDMRCSTACVSTLAAMCSMGPPSQSDCEITCQGFLTGMCATQFMAYLTCGSGMAITCDAGGRPIVAACSTQAAAFQTCLGG